MRWVLLKVNFEASEGIANSLTEAFFICGSVLQFVIHGFMLKITSKTLSHHLPKILTILFIISLAIVAPVNAGLMKLDFKGSITSISSPFYAPPGINLGDDVTGELIYDSATPDGQPLTWIGYYPDSIKRFTLKIGDDNFPMVSRPDNSEIDVINDDLVFEQYYDNLLFRVAVLDQTAQEERFFQLTFAQSAELPPIVLTTDALATPININNFATKTGFLTYLPPLASQGNNFTLTFVDLYPFVGDFDGDLTIEIADAILGLQVVANTSLIVKAYPNADVNGDGQVGLEEVIYILQVLSNIRP